MFVITIPDYFMGRDQQYAQELTPDLRANATHLLMRVNALLTMYYAEHPDADHPHVTSGWRPRVVNARTTNAAVNSKHMTCQAIDLHDPDGLLDEWCMDSQQYLEQFGLWQEHPSATKGWAHLQSVPPKSGKRVFYP